MLHNANNFADNSINYLFREVIITLHHFVRTLNTFNKDKTSLEI